MNDGLDPTADDVRGKLKRRSGIIDSMTPSERQNPEQIDQSRRRRIADGAGADPNEVKKLVTEINGARQCVACKRAIVQGATKCDKCGAAQNWRRHLQISSTVLSLLVALVTATGIVATLLVTTFRTDFSQIEVSARAVSIYQREAVHVDATVLVTNTGTASGYIESAEIQIHHDDGKRFTTRLNIDPANAVVEPDTLRVIKLSGIAGPLEIWGAADWDISHVELHLVIVRHDTSEKPLTIHVPKELLVVEGSSKEKND